jgi:hypothetical protein
MTFAADWTVLYDRLDDELASAPQPATNLFSKIIAAACTRIPIRNKAGKAAKIDRLIEARAWTDAALALIEAELPAWKLRRLVCENGEWFCSLSRQPNLPVDLDDSADAVHQELPLAILRAFIEARRKNNTETAAAVVPQFRQAGDGIVACCDDFA